MNYKMKLHNIKVRIYRFLMFDCRFALTPLKWFFADFDKFGIWFWHNGDEVCWNWPWRNKNEKKRFISVSFSGTGEFGDARYSSLKELDKNWDDYDLATKEMEKLSI
ncbi:MAG: hypothetical protein AABY22_33650 [Nanoarchaeota archaeon]